MIKDLPGKLQRLRASYGFTQRQVADRLGVSPSLVSGYETGERTPNVEVLLALAYLYNCSVDYLLGKPSAELPHAIDAKGLTDTQAQALRALVAAIRQETS